MLGVTGWRQNSSGILVSVAPHVLERMARHRQLSEQDAEAGGLLVGLRRGRHVQITEMTEPRHSDARSRFMFVRNVAGHVQAMLAQWKASGGCADYVGEWHTHPQSHPTPSALDRSEWLRLAAERLDARPMVFIIVGTEHFYGALATRERIEALTATETSTIP